MKCPDCNTDMKYESGWEYEYYACPKCRRVWNMDRLAEAWEALADYWKEECDKHEGDKPR